jgi:hypothetical protein
LRALSGGVEARKQRTAAPKHNGPDLERKLFAGEKIGREGALSCSRVAGSDSGRLAGSLEKNTKLKMEIGKKPLG